MPAYVPAPGVLQVVQYFSTGAANAANVWYVHSETDWTAGAINGMIDIFQQVETDEFGDNRAVEVACTGYRATDLTSLNGLTIFRAVNQGGNVVGPAAPLNCTWALKLVTGKRGRGRQGRKFWFGFAEAQVNAYEVDPNQATGIIANHEVLRATIAGEPGKVLCVLHKNRDGVPLNPHQWDEVISIAYTDLLLDSMKLRLPGKKRHRRAPVAP